MAVRDAARKSTQDTNRAIEAYYSDRLLERVFSEAEPSFVLKGGRSILARTINARYTRDTDFLYLENDPEKALAELKRLASIDLGDFIEFRFVSADPIAEDQEYRNGYRVVFSPVLGGTKTMNDVSVDLVVDEVALETVDVVKPANRLEIRGLPIFDYRIYPAVNAIADKVCATLQTYPGGRASSRVRDLVDLVVYVTRETISGYDLSERIVHEARLRHLELPESFAVPDTWRDNLSRTYKNGAREASIANELQDIEKAERLVKRCIDPAITGKVEKATWNPQSLKWEELA